MGRIGGLRKAERFGNEQIKPEQMALTRLREEIVRLKQGNEIIKKRSGVLRE